MNQLPSGEEAMKSGLKPADKICNLSMLCPSAPLVAATRLSIKPLQTEVGWENGSRAEEVGCSLVIKRMTRAYSLNVSWPQGDFLALN